MRNIYLCTYVRFNSCIHVLNSYTYVCKYVGVILIKMLLTIRTYIYVCKNCKLYSKFRTRITGSPNRDKWPTTMVYLRHKGPSGLKMLDILNNPRHLIRHTRQVRHITRQRTHIPFRLTIIQCTALTRRTNSMDQLHTKDNNNSGHRRQQ